MNRKDYRRLAKISLASRKSTTRSTIRGISFGLILLIPVIFIAVALYTDLNAQVNKNPELLFAQIETSTPRSGYRGFIAKNEQETYNTAFGYQEIDKLLDSSKAAEVFVYEQIEFNYNYKDLTVTEDDDNIGMLAFGYYTGSEGTLIPVYAKNIDYNWQDRSPSTFAAVMDMEKSSGIFSEKITDKFDGVFVEGMDKGFTNGGKGQVILAEVFVNALGLEAEDVYGETFSLKYLDNSNSGYGRPIIIDNDNDPTNNSYNDFINSGSLIQNPGMFSAFLCCEFEVVGIIKSEVTKFAHSALKISDYSPSSHLACNLMFFTTESLYTEDNAVIEPIITQFLPDDENNFDFYNMATYTMPSLELEELNSEYIALGANIFSTVLMSGNRGYDQELYSKQRIIFEADNYKQLDDQMKALSGALAPYLANVGQYYNLSYTVASSIYQQLSMLYSIFTYVIMVLSIIGGIIFFAAMVNLFNSIVHSVDLRRNYLGVMRAIGAKNSAIPKLYLAESFTIFRRALIWIVIFAGLLCYGIKLALDSAFAYINQTGMFPVQLGVNIIYIPVAIGVGVFVLMLLGIMFSYGCSRKVSKRPITEVLSAS